MLLENSNDTQTNAVPIVPNYLLFMLLMVPISAKILLFIASIVFGIFDFSELFAYITNPGLLFFFYPMLIIPAIISFMYFKSLVARYGAGKLDSLTILKFWRYLHSISIVYFAFFPLLEPFSLRFCNFSMTTVAVFGFWMANIAAVFFASLFTYILFTQRFESFLSFMPFHQEAMSLNFTQRFILVVSFVTLANCAVFGALLTDFQLITNMGFFSWAGAKLLPGTILCFVFTIADVYALANNIGKRLDGMQVFSKTLADGNYSIKTMPVISRDQLGALVNDMNNQLVKNKSLIQTIIENIESTSLISSSLVSNVTETASTTEQMVRNIESVKVSMSNQSTAVEESEATINQISKTIESLNESIETQGVTLVQSSSSIEEMVASIRSVSDILDKNNKTMQELLKASQDAKAIVQNATTINKQVQDESEGLLEAANIIQNIASQTNLLAMNAAIEAAHAGDAGNGFAVVADEIRKLAEESSSQGQSISNVLKSVKDKISNIAEATLNVDSQFLNMQNFISELDNQERTIQNAMNEQASGGGQVLAAIKKLNDISEIVKSGSSEMLLASKEVSNEMSKLSDATHEINSNMDQLLSGTSQIGASVNEIREITQANDHSVQKLNEATKNFKV